MQAAIRAIGGRPGSLHREWTTAAEPLPPRLVWAGQFDQRVRVVMEASRVPMLPASAFSAAVQRKPFIAKEME